MGLSGGQEYRARGPAWDAVRRALLLLLLTGCGPVVAQLHPVSADAFTFGARPHSPHVPFGPFEGTPEERFGQLVSRARERLDGASVPGGAIAIVLDGHLAFSTGVGTRERGLDAPVGARTRFRSASITKMLIAATILSLVDDGLLALDDRVLERLPSFSRGAGHDPSAVTIAMLLSHTGGIPDSVYCPDGASLDETLAAHASDPYWAPPGRLFDYSNAGYALLAAIVEQVTGRRFEDAVSERVLAPAGMATAGFEAREEDPDLARGHVGDRVVWTHPVDCEASRAAGGVVASVEDFAHFAEVLIAGGGDVLSAESVEAMTTGRATMLSEPLVRYGLGLVEAHHDGLGTVEHGGFAFGFATHFLVVPERRFAVVVMMNGPVPPDAVARAAMSAFLDVREAREADVPAPPASWADYVGEYEDSTGSLGHFDVVVDGDALVARFRADRPVTLPFGLQASFERDEAHEVEYLVTRVGVARRVR